MPTHDPGDQTGAPPSVLHRPGTTPGSESAWVAAGLADLHLEPVIATIVKGRGPDLAPLFRVPLRGLADVAYRHDVFRDLARGDLRARVAAFARSMQGLRARGRFTAMTRSPRRAQRLALTDASTYCAAVTSLTEALDTEVGSEALRGVAAYLRRYVRSPSFSALHHDVRCLERDLAGVRYGLEFLEDRVHVSRAVGHEDYAAAVERTFGSFRRPGPQRDVERAEPDDTNAVEAEILERVARLHPEVFGALEAFARRHVTYVDDGVERFELEVRFYLAYLAYVDGFEAAGLRFCLPEVSADDQRPDVRGAFDIALAGQLLEGDERVVVNDVRLEGAERVFVVTGANQGGKSTFARMVGQLHYLAALGCPVPAQAARLYLFGELLTHFDRSEDLGTLQGKLHAELTRLRELLAQATPRSVVVMNEAFSSTSSDDALALGRGTLERILDLGALGVFVTFVDELSSFDPRIASVTTVVPTGDPSRRTFELVRRPAAGSAHALALAHGYGLTYQDLRRRLGS